MRNYERFEFKPLERFNRDEVFTKEDISLVLKIINNLPSDSREVENVLYGLLDGYLYEEIMSLVPSNTDTEFLNFIRLGRVLDKVEDSIKKVRNNLVV